MLQKHLCFPGRLFGDILCLHKRRWFSGIQPPLRDSFSGFSRWKSTAILPFDGYLVVVVARSSTEHRFGICHPRFAKSSRLFSALICFLLLGPSYKLYWSQYFRYPRNFVSSDQYCNNRTVRSPHFLFL